MWFVGNVDSGFVVKSARGLTIDGVQYPRNIFTHWSKEELAVLNILPYREVNIDSKYQWQGELTRAIVAGEVVGTYAGIDRDVDTLKASMLDQINSKGLIGFGLEQIKVVRQFHLMLQHTQQKSMLHKYLKKLKCLH